MTVTVRHLQPCEVCEGQRAIHSCPLLWEEAQGVGRTVEKVAAIIGEKTPDAEVVIDCKSFKRRSSLHCP